MQHIYNFEQMVLSDRGVVPITSLLPGDYIFDAGTGNSIPVFGIKKLPLKELVEITYSDGRIMYSHPDQYIATHYTVGSPNNSNVCMARIEAFIKHPELITNGLTNITQNPMNISSVVIKPDNVDYYFIAPFIVYGDFSDPYMNLPASMRTDIHRWIKCNPHISVSPPLRSDKIYFTNRRYPVISWAQSDMNMIDRLDFSVKDYLMKVKYSGINNIAKFIRALCDIDVDICTMTDNNVVNIKLYNVDPNISIIIRDMIIMLGITCRLETMMWCGKRIYCIRILGGDITQLFYDENILAEILKFTHREPNSVSITGIKVIPEHEEFYQIIVDNKYHHRCYLSPNMLPTVINDN